METFSKIFGCKAQCCAKDCPEQDVVILHATGGAGISPAGLPGPPSDARRSLELEPPEVNPDMARWHATCTDAPARGSIVERMMVGGGNDRDVVVQPPSPKTTEEVTLMVNAVRRNRNLQTVLALEDKFCNEMIEMAWKESVEVGLDVIKQGDIGGDYFFIVADGVLDVIVDDKRVFSMKRGDSFGELALLYLAPRASTVRTISHAVLWVVDRCHFKAILARAAELHLLKYAKHLHSIVGMETLTKKVRLEVANALDEMHYECGSTVYRVGDRGDSFFLFFDGELSIVRNGKEERVKGEPHHPVILGEKALSEAVARRESVVVKSATATAVTMDRARFDMLMKKVKLEKDNRKRIKEGLPTGRFGSSEYLTDTWKMRRQTNVRHKDIRIVGPLGVGAFGLVELVEHMPTRETYALKTMSKGYIVQSGLQSSVLYEKNIQFMCESPFIVKLIETFNTSQTMSFLQEAVLGGELTMLYTRRRLWGETAHTKFYCAGVVLALEHMHEKCIIYRDLKPENVLIHASGRPKITDMGLAKLSPGKTYTCCGALVSMSPEVIKCTGHNNGTDWWTLGIMMYELMAMETPFNGSSPTDIYAKIFTGFDRVEFKRGMAGDCEDLIKGLCEQLVFKRLTMRPGGIDNLKQHGWYKGFDWGSLASESMVSPYKPDIQGKTDMSNFSPNIESRIPMECSYQDDGSLWDKDFATSW